MIMILLHACIVFRNITIVVITTNVIVTIDIITVTIIFVVIFCYYCVY